MELDAGIRSRKSPFDPDPLLVTGAFPSFDFRAQRLLVSDEPAQALSFEDADFALGRIQPAPVLRREVKLQALAQTQRFRQLEGRVEAGRTMGVEVVHHQADALRLRVMHVHELLHLRGEVQRGAPRGHL